MTIQYIKYYQYQKMEQKQEQIITVSPLLFSAINYKSKQADAVEKIDEHVNEYVLSSSKTISDNVQTKQKTDWD